MICITGNEDYIIKLTDHGEFICFKGKPYVNALLYNCYSIFLFKFFQMLVVENDIILYKSVFKSPFRK